MNDGFVDPEHITVAKDLVAGTIAGSAGIVVGQPLDRVKVLKQTASTQTSSSLSLSSRSTLATLQLLAKNEGPLSLWRGVSAPLLGAAPLNALVFAGNGWANRFLDTHPSLSSINNNDRRFVSTSGKPYLQYFYSGCFGGLVQSFVAAPSELVKCKMQIQTKSLSNSTPPLTLSTMIRQIYRSEGLIGFTRGFALTAFRDTPSYGVYFLAYEIFKDSFARIEHRQSQPSIAAQLMAGGLAGCVSWLSCFPVDVVKSVVQTSPAKVSTKTVIQQNYAQHGIKFFFRGMHATMLRAFAVNSVTFLVFENVVASLQTIEASTEPQRSSLT